MIIVTGGADFIGSNTAKVLNNKGITDILVVNSPKDGAKSVNLVDLDIADYMNKEDFLIQVTTGEGFGDTEAIFHKGACSSTTKWDDEHMIDGDYQYSEEPLHYCLKREVPFLYTSSTATYGGHTPDPTGPRKHEEPLNVYDYSKFLFDEYVRQILSEANLQIIGPRYFNVYGPREGHKDSMTSVAFHLNTQLNNGESPKLFESSENFKRSFVYVGDVADTGLWFLEGGTSSTPNLGTGRAESFQVVADATLTYHKRDQIEYIPFPDRLKGRYQAFTRTDLTNLRTVGYDKPFKAAVGGITEYMAWLDHDT